MAVIRQLSSAQFSAPPTELAPPPPQTWFPEIVQWLKTQSRAPPASYAELLEMLQSVAVLSHRPPAEKAELEETVQWYNVHSMAPPPMAPAELPVSVHVSNVPPATPPPSIQPELQVITQFVRKAPNAYAPPPLPSKSLSLSIVNPLVSVNPESTAPLVRYAQRTTPSPIGPWPRMRVRSGPLTLCTVMALVTAIRLVNAPPGATRPPVA